MKNLIFFITFLIISSGNLLSQSRWFWQNPYPQGNNLWSLSVFNADNVILVGDAGTIVKTTNGGNNWLFKNNVDNIQSNLSDVYFLNNFEGFICAGDKIFKTTNGGTNWQLTFLGYSAYLNAIQFVDQNTGWCIGYKIYKTTNGGNNWFEMLNPEGQQFYSLFFSDSQFGWISGYVSNSFYSKTYIYRTTNGGGDWSLSFSYTGTSGAYKVADLCFTNQNTGFGIGGNSGSNYGLIKTTDSGNSWYNLDGVYGSKVYFYNNEIGWIVSDGYSLKKTTNAGNNWFTVGGTYTSINDIKFNNIHTGYIASQFGQIYKTTDGGNLWSNLTNLLTSGYNQDLFFINQNSGFVVGQSGEFLRTSNGGKTWDKRYIGTQTINSIYFINDNTGWLGTLGGVSIFKTINGGENWTANFQSSFGVFDILFTNPDVGFASLKFNLSDYKILRTTNSGNNWFLQDVVIRQVLDICAIDSTNILIGGDGTTASIQKSSDGGVNWINCIVPSDYISDIEFINNYTGFAVGKVSISRGRVYKSTDGGMNWEYLTLLGGAQAMRFLNETKGFMISEAGKVFYTNDGGNTWDTLILASFDFSAIFACNDSLAWIIGRNGTILHTRNLGVVVVSVQPISTKIPLSFSLHQNYPNPFNPVTKIMFDILNQSTAKIIIYDLLGREITTLVNEQLKPGSYSVDWDGTGFASGVYFYSLVTDEFAETKRMVLIK